MTLSIWIQHLTFHYVKNCQLISKEKLPNSTASQNCCGRIRKDTVNGNKQLQGNTEDEERQN